ncbi:hypothetical protein ACGYLO_10945 [Sulfitobacter sp. 1A13353]|uniref:hypothetical protein n=1 Tax=Sulfitobacter sp. 1A13353 TaxID=3368568 RepID=UPI0037473686
MHTIYMGDTCLLRADPLAAEGPGPGQYRDLAYGAKVSEANSLASLFDSAAFATLKAAGTLPLQIYAGRGRALEIMAEDSDDGVVILVKDEMGSCFDFHEVTLGALFNQPAFEEA